MMSLQLVSLDEAIQGTLGDPFRESIPRALGQNDAPHPGAKSGLGDPSHPMYLVVAVALEA